MPTTETPLTPRLWTVEEYHQLAEAGILQPDEPVELIAGQIVKKMSTQKSPHAAAITRIERVMRNALGERVSIRIQLPIRLGDRSEPEPDIAVVRVDPLDYDDAHPTASDVYLIVEVAYTTLKTDCDIKGKNYAQSSIADYWVLDVNHRQLHVFREPMENGYQREVVLEDDSTIAPWQFPDVWIAVREMLRPASA